MPNSYEVTPFNFVGLNITVPDNRGNSVDCRHNSYTQNYNYNAMHRITVIPEYLGKIKTVLNSC